MKLKANQTAIHFICKDIDGKEISISNLKGKKVLLSFYRYSSCPFCNLRISHLIEKHEHYKSKGLVILSIFMSTKEDINKYVGKQKAPFSIISDPKKEIYRLYGVESSWFGLFKGFLSIKKMFDAIIKKGYFSALGDMFSNRINGIPADFLIDENSIIHCAYYGKDISDHIPFSEIEKFIGLK